MTRAFLTLAALATAGFPAMADSDSGFYVSGFIGAGALDDAGFRGTQAPEAGAPGMVGAPANVDVGYDSDTVFGGAIGYDTPWEFFGLFHPRLEIEFSHLEVDVDSGSFNGGQQSFGGDTSVDMVLFNNYSDIIWQEGQTVIPFVGGGLGFASVDANVLYAGGGATAPTFVVTDEDTGLAGTFAAGVTWKASANWDLYTEARYFQIRDLNFERRFIGGGADLFSANVEDDLSGSIFTIGTRYNF